MARHRWKMYFSCWFWPKNSNRGVLPHDQNPSYEPDVLKYKSKMHKFRPMWTVLKCKEPSPRKFINKTLKLTVNPEYVGPPFKILAMPPCPQCHDGYLSFIVYSIRTSCSMAQNIPMDTLPAPLHILHTQTSNGPRSWGKYRQIWQNDKYP
jgi:hypothetical protein